MGYSPWGWTRLEQLGAHGVIPLVGEAGLAGFLWSWSSGWQGCVYRWLRGWGRGGLEAAYLPIGGLCATPPPRLGSCLALGVPLPSTCRPLGRARSWGKEPR